MPFYVFPNALTKAECDLYISWCLINTSFDDASTLKSGETDNTLNPEETIQGEKNKKD